jgi:hypothetical protein
MNVHMVHDGRFWFIGADVADEKLTETADAQYPYSGDCFEVMFMAAAGDSTARHLAFQGDINQLVSDPLPDERTFFELQVPSPGITLSQVADHLSDWRTDANFKASAEKEGFTLARREKNTHWRFVAVIPFGAFGKTIQDAITRGNPQKFGFDYLDYDGAAAARTEEDGWGFRPDNVFALDNLEANVIVPACMRSIVFEH